MALNCKAWSACARFSFVFAWCLEFTGIAMDDVLQNPRTSFMMDWTAGVSLHGDFNKALCRYSFYVKVDVDTDNSVEHRIN